MLKTTMLDKKVWAVVGATWNPERYSYKIYKKLKYMGYQVFAVNPLYDVIDGDKCYKNLSSLPEIPDVINMVVSPEIGQYVLEEAAKLGIRYVWFQPGSYNENILESASRFGMETVQACVLTTTKIRKEKKEE